MAEPRAGYQIRRHPDLPVAVGFGVSSGAQAAQVAAFTDGVIVGSDFVRRPLEAADGHDVVARALRVLCHLEHRGAQGGDPGTGDRAGILTQLPNEFFRAVCGFPLPGPSSYAVGLAFISAERPAARPDGVLPAQARRARGRVYFASLSSRTVVYKGMGIDVGQHPCRLTRRRRDGAPARHWIAV